MPKQAYPNFFVSKYFKIDFRTSYNYLPKK